MHTRLVTLLALVGLVACARPAAAQTWSDHARITLNVGAQPSSIAFSGTTNIPVYQQAASVTTAYEVPSGQFFDGGIALRVSGGFGVAIGASYFTKSQAAPISGSIPHPLLANRTRPIAGTSPDLERREIVGHIDFAYVVTAGRLDVAVSGGPAFFTVDQDLVSNVTFADAAPYDTVTFTGAVVTRATATQIGFSTAVDVGVKLSKYVGVGGLLRYSRASLTLPLVATASGVDTDAGGLQAGGGLRVYF